MLLTEDDIASLLRQQPITDEWPWSTKNEPAIYQHIQDIITEIGSKNRLLDRTEFGHYGSGYASFVDCWLYREDDEFRFDSGNCYWGLVVLFSTLSQYYVIGEGQKTWHRRGGSSYLPSFQLVDQINHPAIQQIVDGVCISLRDRGLVRAHVSDLTSELPRETDVPTILSDPPWRHFDALFYWED